MRHVALAISFAALSIGCVKPDRSTKQENCLHTFAGHSDFVCAVALSPDGKQIVSGGADGKIKVWDVESGQCLRTLAGHDEWVQSVALSPDARFLASGGRDDLVKLWEVESGKQLQTFAGHSGLVTSVAYSPDGRLLASCGQDKVIRIWEVASGRSVKALDTDDFFTSSAVVFASDSKRVLFGGDFLQLWDIDTGKCLHVYEGHSDTIRAIAFSQNGKWIASAGAYTDRTIKLWDAASGNCLWNKQFAESEGGARSLTFTSEDNALISGHHGGQIRFWDVQSGNAVHTLRAHSEVVSSLSADAKGRCFVSASWDKCLKLWKVPSVKSLR